MLKAQTLLVRFDLITVGFCFLQAENIRRLLLNERMQSLRMEAFDAGLNPYAIANNLLDIENNPDASSEMLILLQEIIWQVNDILHELRRRWPKIDQTGQSPQTSEIQGWISDVELLLATQDR